MNTRNPQAVRPSRPLFATLLAGLLAVGLSAPPAAADDGAVEPQAREHLQAMSDLLAGADTLAFKSYIVRDQVLDYGQKVQLSQHRDVTLARPGQIRVHGHGDIDNISYWFNAGSLTALDTQRNVYTSIETPDTIEPMLDFLAAEKGMVVPMADLLVDDPYASAMLGKPAGWYLGLHEVRGVPAHHLVFRQAGIDWQIWIDAGEQPVPLKLTITYASVATQPQWSAEFSDWQINPEVDADAFVFAPPADAAELAPAEFAGRADAQPAAPQE